MNEARSNPDEPARAEAKSRWKCPSLTFVGDLKDLVRGEGKVSGDPNDSDMKLDRKSPNPL